MLESSTLEKEKQDAFQSMLRTGRVLVWVNMMHDELVVPHAVQVMPLSPLAYTPEVRPQATNEGIAAVMWLGGRTFPTFVPWTAVYFMGSKRGQMSWLQHAPADITAEDLESISADLDAEYDDYLVEDDVDRQVVVGVGAPTSEEAAAAPPLAPRSQAGDGGEPEPANSPSSTGTTFPRASSPSLTVIDGGGGQDAED